MAVAALLAGYVVARLVMMVNAEAFRTFDSRSYAGRLDGRNFTEVLSFTGGSPRPWGAPLLYALTGDDQSRAWLQGLVGMVAWVVLVVAVCLCLRGLTARVVATVALLLLALTPQVYVWDHTLLSESLSISLGLLTAGLLVIGLRTGSRVALAVAAPVAVWWIFTRPDVLLYVGLVLVALVLVVWRLPQRRRGAVAVLAVLLAGLGWMAAIQGSTDRTFARWSATGLPQTEETFLYRLMVQVMDDPQMRATYYTDLGMPRCVAVETATDRVAWRISEVAKAYRSCPELIAWTEEHSLLSGYRYALADPGHYATTTREDLRYALGGHPLHTYGKPVTMLPTTVQRAYFPPVTVVLPALVVAGLVAVAVAVASGAWRRRPWLVVAGLAAALASVASVLVSLMFSAGEYSRFGIQEAIYLRVALILLVVVALDTASTRWAARRGR
ncbi:hypothetical protein CA850_12510 [Micromonospora echinospora]|nr:hypothetical protein CA850_12510 [Micromonospora echinospora]